MIPATISPRRAIVRRVLVALLLLGVMGYAGIVVWLMTQETRLVFQAGQPLGPARPSVPYQEVDVPRVDGARQFAWVFEHHSESPWVLFLHGNRATIASRTNILHYEQLLALGLNVLAPEYRGFGGLEGVPSEASLGVDARAAYDFLRERRNVAPERIIIYGWSLGAAVAVNLAATVPQAAVVLEGAPASLVAIGQRQYPWVPIRLVMRNPFDVITRVGRIEAPILFLHSPEDAVIPIAEGRRLYEAVRSRKSFVEVRGGHVRASEVDAAAFFGGIKSFLAETALLQRVAAASAR